MNRPVRPPFAGPALFSYGFRPLFLLAGLWAVVVVPLWMAIRSGAVTLNGPFSPTDWHIHELLFGYTSVVIAGFLFTAIPNWTGRMPTRGWPLVALSVLWLAGRVIVALGPWPVVVMLVDCAFMAVIGAMVATEIIAGRNWGNLKVVGPVLLYLVANVIFHLEAMSRGQADIGRRLGFATVALLILLIGGRILPSFTRNWLAKRGPGALPVPFARFDAGSLVLAALALTCWVVAPQTQLAGVGLMLAGALQLARLLRWCGWRVWREPLLLMLHVAFAFVAAGLLGIGLAALGILPAATGLHLLGIGGIGGMTLAVMMRASLGHTGRPTEAGLVLALAFGAVVLAAGVRAMSPEASGLWTAAAFWTFGFILFLWHFAPILAWPNPARRKPNAAPSTART
ncbi:short-chain dehydrogenase [Tabrizicola piscis]|uniref:Short-chain dehydrogenase n=1 Tax=Tabrizicola piscis TaxID=2494374 RepID=A0A3S8U3Q0_9RHOB|nr:NnrS family protein [Tabrizicola piscis]AZL58200.1 short-chain dehydrogenase [Tabrizicola piscis]